MRDAFNALNAITRQGVISGYAIGGAVAAFYYIEASFTEDIDAFAFLAPAQGSLLITLAPIYKALIALGGQVDDEHVRFGHWKLQILPADDGLVGEAIRNAADVEYSGVPVRIFTPEYLCAIALAVGRPKDYIRINEFMDRGAVDMSKFQSLAENYGLARKLKTRILDLRNAQ